jgi:shikimate kinase / 3-dehydroquinate synthase
MPDGIVLVGMPASGKTSVGRVVAERLRRPFVDTDELVARRLGMPVPAYLERYGEAAFRAVEATAVAEACGIDGAVIAAGGGAVIDPLNRWALWHHGSVGWLDVTPERLVERLRSDPVARPTFRPYEAGRLAAVLAERAPAYRASDARLDAERTPDAIANNVMRIRRAGNARRLLDLEVARHHPIGPQATHVVMGVELDAGAHPGGVVAVVDERVVSSLARLVAALSPNACLAIRAGERTKRLRGVERILEWLADERIERGTPLAAIGGGTIGDLVGTAAALYARGLPLVQVPTTWLAQADSAIGGKVGVDLRAAKNAAGAFWPPVSVLSDIAALRTLPPRLRRDGMAESVKSALIGDPALWRLIEERGPAALRDDEAARYAIVERSARLKLGVCARDPFEAGERRTLNLGHTIGHALEVESRYRLRHGSAVALGLRGVARIAAGRGGDPELAPRLDALLRGLGFTLRHRFDPDAVMGAMLGDKKRLAGRQRWILPMEIGRVVEADDVSDDELRSALTEIRA